MTSPGRPTWPPNQGAAGRPSGADQLATPTVPLSPSKFKRSSGLLTGCEPPVTVSTLSIWRSSPPPMPVRAGVSGFGGICSTEAQPW